MVGLRLRRRLPPPRLQLQLLKNFPALLFEQVLLEKHFPPLLQQMLLENNPAVLACRLRNVLRRLRTGRALAMRRGGRWHQAKRNQHHAEQLPPHTANFLAGDVFAIQIHRNVLNPRLAAVSLCPCHGRQFQ